MFLFYLSADSTLSNIWRHLSEAMKSSSVGQRLVFGAPSDFSAPIKNAIKTSLIAVVSRLRHTGGSVQPCVQVVFDQSVTFMLRKLQNLWAHLECRARLHDYSTFASGALGVGFVLSLTLIRLSNRESLFRFLPTTARAGTDRFGEFGEQMRFPVFPSACIT